MARDRGSVPAAAALACLALTGGVSCRKAEDPAVRIEFDRHLRQAREQMMRALPESARAEFDKCAALRPDDPELLFHQARMKLFPGAGAPDTEGAISLLSRVAEKRPDSVKTHRLLAELEARRGRPEAARRHEAAAARLYGTLPELERANLGALTMPVGLQGVDVSLPDGIVLDAQSQAFVTAMRRLMRPPDFNPNEAVPELQKRFGRFSDLPVLRLRYAQTVLSLWMKVSALDKPDEPLMSSKVVLEMTADHVVGVYDQVAPGSPAALQALAFRTEISMRLGDWDDALTFADIVLRWPGLPEDRRREFLVNKAVALTRKGEPRRAFPFFEQALAGDAGRSPRELQFLWLMRVAQDRAGIPEGRRGKTFRFAPDIVRDPARSPFSYEEVAGRYRINKLLGLGPTAWGDYDRDGDDDLFLSGLDAFGMLLRNDKGVFQDVSKEAGLFHVKSGWSATFADYDNDGWPDLYIGRLGWSGPAPNALYHNNGDGTFTDVTKKAGVESPGSSFVIAWADVDRDGWLDLFVANGCAGYGDTNILYHNNGDGTFTDVTAKAGLQEPRGARSVGFAFGDYDDDGWPDLFIAGVQTPNRLYRNRGDGTFEDVTQKAGVADPEHKADVFLGFFTDYDNDGRLDILRTTEAELSETLLALSDRWAGAPAEKKRNALRQSLRLYRNAGDGTFTDVSEKTGISRYVNGAMGSMMGDLDNDGYEDLYLATGGPPLLWLEPDRLLRNNGNGTFSDVTFASGLGCLGKGHGNTFIDIDGDGSLEIMVNEGGFVMGDPFPPVLYRNRKPTGNHWLEVDLEGTKSNREGTGARLSAQAGSLRVLREAQNGNGFGSSNPRTVHFGLGKNARVERLEIRWPSGLKQAFTDLPADQRIFVREGENWVRWRPASAAASPRRWPGK